MIVRRAAQRAGVFDRVSPHWLRHAHASHALDHGAPIHLVQATLGHGSVATTSRYVHARPGDSSARFLALERFPTESARIALPSFRAGVMNVVIAAAAAKGERQKMSTNNAETKETAPVSGEPPRKANTRAQKPRVAPAKGKAGKKATPAKKGHKANSSSGFHSSTDNRNNFL
jgi:Phage integrase family